MGDWIVNLLILDGSNGDLKVLNKFTDDLILELINRGWDTEILHLYNEKIATCNGCFGCWIKTPGQCLINDKGWEIAGKIIRSDLLVYSTPITFGGYSYQLKKMVDRVIPNTLPFFEQVNGEIHHKKRYQHNPNLLGIGYQHEKDPESERIFRALIKRNALNMRSHHNYTFIIDETYETVNISSILDDSGVLT